MEGRAMSRHRYPDALTASECIDMHIDQVEWLRTSEAESVLKRFNELFQPGNEPLNWTKFTKPEKMARSLRDSLSEADTFYVTGEMLQIASEASVDLEGMPLFERDLVSRNMLILFDQSAGITMMDGGIQEGERINDEDFPLRAVHVMHQPQQVRVVKDGKPDMRPEGLLDGAAIFYWSDADRMFEVGQKVEERVGRLPTPPKGWMSGPLAPVDFTAWAYGTQWQSMTWDRRRELDEMIATDAFRGHPWEVPGTNTSEVSPHIGEQRRLLLSILLLMKEEVYRERMLPDRAARRRWKASSVIPPEDYCVTVTKLRRVTDGEHLGDEEGESHYSHRFTVRGHWRRIRKGTPDERAVWVRPHIKGPEYAPFVPKGRVTILER
jgi:hypothetical protein